MSSAGDVNGDGLADLIIGAIAANPDGKSGAGKSYVVFGKKGDNDAVHLSDIADGIGGFVIHGEFPGDDSGYSLCSAGDVNGDGFVDLIIGSPDADFNGNKSGSTYVVL